MITMVESSIAEWSTTPWREINVEDMELHCKQFAKDIKVLDKEVSEESSLYNRLLAFYNTVATDMIAGIVFLIFKVVCHEKKSAKSYFLTSPWSFRL